MDKNSKKVLNFLCVHKSEKYSISMLSSHFSKIPKDYLVEIIHDLYKDKCIKFYTDSSIRVTNKGITYLSVIRSNWIAEHIISICALVVSILAFIRTL